MSPTRTPTITILTERETGETWEFIFSVSAAPDPSPPDDPAIAPLHKSDDSVLRPLARHTALTLSWADYDYWCGGSESPSDLARRIIAFILTRKALSDLPGRFDAALIRRWWRDGDRAFRQFDPHA